MASGRLSSHIEIM